jgi:hypothetical protein
VNGYKDQCGLQDTPQAQVLCLRMSLENYVELENTPQNVTLNASHSSPLEGRWDKCVQHLGRRGVLQFHHHQQKENTV